MFPASGTYRQNDAQTTALSQWFIDLWWDFCSSKKVCWQDTRKALRAKKDQKIVVARSKQRIGLLRYEKWSFFGVTRYLNYKAYPQKVDREAWDIKTEVDFWYIMI
jgi:hypothetical protein